MHDDSQFDILQYHARGYGKGAIISADLIGNADIGNPSGVMGDISQGRISLGMLSAVVVGLMFFYVVTRKNQY